MIHMDLPGFVRVLREIPPQFFRDATLEPLLKALRLDPVSVAPYLNFQSGTYTRNLVYANAGFEVMVLCWDAGAASPIHNHDGQHCWMVAHSGSFTVDNYRIVRGGFAPGFAHIEPSGTDRDVTVGVPDYRGLDDTVHRVSVEAGTAPAVSIHVYAKPLTRCLIYDEQGQRCLEKRMRYDTIRPDLIKVA